MKHCTRAVAVTLGLLFAATASWAALTPDQVAARIRAKMCHMGTIANLKIAVTPYPDNAKLAQGAFRQIKVTADSITVDGVKMTQVLMQAQDLVLDIPRLARGGDVKVLKRSSDRVHARVSEADLNRALTFKQNTIENMRVKLGTGTITFTGRYKFGLATSLMLQGRLEVPDGYNINFVPKKGSVGGVPLPATVLRTVLRKMNPLLNLKKMPMAPKVDRIIVQPGYLTIDG